MEEEDPSRRLHLLEKHRIVDIYETSGGYLVVTENGRELLVEKHVGRQLYWDIKSRNRRKAFGL